MGLAVDHKAKQMMALLKIVHEKFGANNLRFFDNKTLEEIINAVENPDSVLEGES